MQPQSSLRMNQPARTCRPDDVRSAAGAGVRSTSFYSFGSIRARRGVRTVVLHPTPTARAGSRLFVLLAAAVPSRGTPNSWHPQLVSGANERQQQREEKEKGLAWYKDRDKAKQRQRNNGTTGHHNRKPKQNRAYGRKDRKRDGNGRGGITVTGGRVGQASQPTGIDGDGNKQEHCVLW